VIQTKSVPANKPQYVVMCTGNVQIPLDRPDQTLSETQVYDLVSDKVWSGPLACPTSPQSSISTCTDLCKTYNTLLTILAAVTAVESGIIDARQSVYAGTMPQRTLILYTRVGFLHLGLAYHVLLIQPRILNAFNLTTKQNRLHIARNENNQNRIFVPIPLN